VADLGRYAEADPIGLNAGLNIYSYVDASPLIYADPHGLGKIGFAIRAIQGGWRYVTKSEARRTLDRRGDVRVTGPGASGDAKRLARERFGDRTVRHDAHARGQMPHYQHRNGGRGHVYYEARGLIGIGAGLGSAIFGEDTWGADVVDFFNPLSDIQDVWDFVDPLETEFEQEPADPFCRPEGQSVNEPSWY
jgi:hypothetical protein